MTITPAMFPVAAFSSVKLEEANYLLEKWGHKMGPCVRGNSRGWSHALFYGSKPVGVVVTASLIRERVGGAPQFTRENTVEVARLCAERPGLCRVVLRMWREFVFPSLNYAHAISYQDAKLHTGNLYRFDGWQRIAFSHSGRDSRSGRVGRNKYVWLYPPKGGEK